MELRDNVLFNINGRDREYFDLAMKLAVGVNAKDVVKFFYVDEEKNRLILLWALPSRGPSVSHFMTPLGPQAVADQVWEWLKTRKPTEEAWDHDGHSEQGWRFFVDDVWGHVEPFDHCAIVAIEPVWIEYGK